MAILFTFKATAKRYSAQDIQPHPTDGLTVRWVAPWFRFFPRYALEHQKPKNRDSDESCFDATTKIRHLQHSSESNCRQQHARLPNDKERTK